MKHVVIIGGKGKVGTYLVPMLCEAGYRVTNISRGESKPYLPHGCWNSVRQVALDRNGPDFSKQIAALRPDIVIDMICFKAEDMCRLIDMLAGTVQHYLVCGSVWIHGQSVRVPCKEHEALTPFGEYGAAPFPSFRVPLSIRDISSGRGICLSTRRATKIPRCLRH